MWCNLLAGDAVFDNVEDKRAYILGKQGKKSKSRRAVCTDCMLPYSYREHSPSLFLCAECYDIEYGTEYSKRTKWKHWLKTLKLAGIYPDIHRKIRRKWEGCKLTKLAEVVRLAYDEKHVLTVDV